jgi:hypothetical protein
VLNNHPRAPHFACGLPRPPRHACGLPRPPRHACARLLPPARAHCGSDREGGGEGSSPHTAAPTPQGRARRRPPHPPIARRVDGIGRAASTAKTRTSARMRASARTRAASASAARLRWASSCEHSSMNTHTGPFKHTRRQGWGKTHPCSHLRLQDTPLRLQDTPLLAPPLVRGLILLQRHACAEHLPPASHITAHAHKGCTHSSNGIGRPENLE